MTSVLPPGSYLVKVLIGDLSTISIVLPVHDPMGYLRITSRVLLGHGPMDDLITTSRFLPVLGSHGGELRTVSTVLTGDDSHG
jgi:hypothetical protein